jgi:bla regulator protein blaR1
MIDLPGSELARALSWTLLHSLWMGACLALALRGFLGLARKSRARHAAAFGALLLLAAAASATLAWDVAHASRGAAGSPQAWLAPGTAASAEFSSLELARVVRASLDRALEPFEPWIAIAWGLGALALLVRLAGGWLWCRREAHLELRRAPRLLQQRLFRLALRLGLTRTPELHVSPIVEVPMVLPGRGLRGVPRIVIGRSCVSGLSDAALEALLLHELEHVRRRDGGFTVLQEALCALFFFHPCAWWIARRIRAEREHCCDDAALEVSRDPLALARALATVEERRCARPRAGWPGSRSIEHGLLVSASGGDLLARIERIVGRPPSAPSPGRSFFLAVACSLAGCTGVALGMVPAHCPREPRESPALARQAGAGPRELERHFVAQVRANGRAEGELRALKVIRLDGELAGDLVLEDSERGAFRPDFTEWGPGAKRGMRVIMRPIAIGGDTAGAVPLVERAEQRELVLQFLGDMGAKGQAETSGARER